MQLRPKHSTTGTTIFATMSGLAQQYGAINLSQGFPDFPLDEQLGQLLHEASAEGFNQYAPMPGLPQLHAAIAADWQQRQGISIDTAAELTITPGATYAIYTAFAATLQPGDEAIVLEPAYDSYIPAIEMAGGIPVPVPLLTPSFLPDWDAVKAAISPHTRAIIINTPHNPTGTVWPLEEYNKLAELVRDTDIIILADEVYEQLVYDGQHNHSILGHEELRLRSFALYSFGKVFQATGWKIGYCIAPPAFTTAFRRIHQYLCFSVNTPAQYALAAYLQLPQPVPVATDMQQRRDYFLNEMKHTPFIFQQPAAGSYFQLASYTGISQLSDFDMAVWLTKEYGVATIPVSAFYRNKKDDKLLRFCFAKKQETLLAAATRLATL